MSTPKAVRAFSRRNNPGTRNTTRRVLLLLGYVTALTVVLTACSDTPGLTSPGGTVRGDALGQLAPVSLAPAQHTLRDEFTAIARRVPGGFGGLYFDDDGSLTILLTDPSKGDEARAALASERFIQDRAAGDGGERFDISGAIVRRGEYAHDQLDEWLGRLLTQLPITPTKSGIRVHSNRILIGVADAAQREPVLKTAAAAGVPDSAVLVEVSPAAVPLTTLYDRVRPVRAGMQTRFDAPNYPWCSLGPNLYWITWHDSTRSVIVASHCTKQIFAADNTNFWQPVYTSGTGNHIGNEVLDPALFSCAENLLHGCRNSDAALVHYATYASYDLGYIARPASRNTGTLTLDASNPRFHITGKFDWAVDGEVIEKVGRTTGWSGGTVVDGCVTMPVTSSPYHSIRCAMIVDAAAGSGDSGAPAFEITSGTLVKIRGTLFAGYGPTNNCTLGVDPVYGGTAIYCPQFVASNLGGIKLDLDPNNNAQLKYW